MTDIEVVEAIYAAMHDRDVPRLIELIDEKVVITQDSRLPWGGRFEVLEGFARFAELLTGTITSAVTHEMLFTADGDVIQVGHTRGTVNESGKPFNIAEVHRWTIQDGKAVRAHFSIDTPGMLAVLCLEA